MYEHIYSSPFCHSSCSQNMEMNMNLYFSACRSSSSTSSPKFGFFCAGRACAASLPVSVRYRLYLAHRITVLMSYTYYLQMKIRAIFFRFIYRTPNIFFLLRKNEENMCWLALLAPIIQAYNIYRRRQRIHQPHQ